MGAVRLVLFLVKLVTSGVSGLVCDAEVDQSAEAVGLHWARIPDEHSLPGSR